MRKTRSPHEVCHRPPFADPDATARKLAEIANAAEAVQDGRIRVELIHAPFLNAGGTPAEYRAGLERAVAKGWLWRHEAWRLREVHPGGGRAVRLMAATSADGRLWNQLPANCVGIAHKGTRKS